MSTFILDQDYSKPLSSPLRDERLPPLPPADRADSTFLPPPPPPPKAQDYPRNYLQIETSLPSASLDPGLVVPLTPAPLTPTSPSYASSDGKPKKSNPLNDLIDTEKAYVDHLTGIIRKVAAAWSRSNLPPPELDTMFRSIEGVYKANRALHSKLKDIGANPSSPKALGDLLMRWIDDLEGPYTAYCTKYRCGFDTWDPVQSNSRLATILSNFSASNPPSSDPAIWSLDSLFLLPKARLKYYKKLYSRLLKSTAPGRSDHRLLVGALDTLDRLLDTLDTRGAVKVGQIASLSPSVPVAVETEDEVVIDLRTQTGNVDQHQQNGRLNEADPESEGSSARESSISGGERLSQETASTSISRGSSSTLSMPISDLERRLSTHRTLDIFTMQPKVVRLQMAPPSLTFTRELRFSLDVVIRFTPRATGAEVVHRQGHVFLLSDLFLVCERMTPEDRAQHGYDGADMWLAYPPLAGKVLRVSDVPGQDNVVQVAIMRKETLFLHADSVQTRNLMLSEFKECIEFAGSLPPPSKQPPPPMPALPSFPQSPSVPLMKQQPQEIQGQGYNGSNISPPQRAVSPPGTYRNDYNSIPDRSQPQPTYPNTSGSMADNMARLILSPEAQVQQGAQRVPSMHDPMPGPMYPRAPSSAQTYPSPPPSVGPGQVSGPTRSTSFGPVAHHDPSRAGPGPGYGPPGTGQYGVPQHNQHPHQQFPPPRQSPYGPPSNGHPSGGLPSRPPSEHSYQGSIRKTPSTRSLASQYEPTNPAPPVPAFPGGYPPNGKHFLPRAVSYGNLQAPQGPPLRPLLPSAAMGSRSVSMAEPSFDEPSPPNSPVEETPLSAGPVTSTISAQMKCKVFLQQQHAQWKSLGSAKLKLYRQDPTNIKQLVVEAEKDKSVLISTIVLTDGVERVGKTGVAIELSDQGARTGIIYMIQLRNEKSAGGLFDSLLAGSDRAAVRG